MFTIFDFFNFSSFFANYLSCFLKYPYFGLKFWGSFRILKTTIKTGLKKICTHAGSIYKGVNFMPRCLDLSDHHHHPTNCGLDLCWTWIILITTAVHCVVVDQLMLYKWIMYMSCLCPPPLSSVYPPAAVLCFNKIKMETNKHETRV